MPEIELNLGNSKVKFEDIVAKGLSRLTIIAMFAYFAYIFAYIVFRFTVNSVKFDQESHSIKLSMVFDQMESTGGVIYKIRDNQWGKD